jgi:probable selenium-dependent hydroxylase accessory protein YqeC
MQPIEKILFREPRGVLSLTGSGGKTSLMFNLARLLVRSGKTVLTTTTTKILVPTAEQSETLLINADPQTILRQTSSRLDTSRHFTAASARLRDNAGKLAGFAPEAIETFAASGLFDWILVEADGSAHRPLKAPAAHEPVIPLNTTVLVAVAGLEVLGEPLTEELVFRSELAGDLMELAAGETITEAAVVRLFAHPFGAFKSAPPNARRFIFLNKADDRERQARAAFLAELIGQLTPAIAEALIVGQARDGIHVHALYPLEVWP